MLDGTGCYDNSRRKRRRPRPIGPSLTRTFCAQPVWKDDVALTASEPPAIDVSAFRVVHAPDASRSGAYERKVLTETITAIEDINAQMWSAENAAYAGPEPVRPRACSPWFPACDYSACVDQPLHVHTVHARLR